MNVRAVALAALAANLVPGAARAQPPPIEPAPAPAPSPAARERGKGRAPPPVVPPRLALVDPALRPAREASVPPAYEVVREAYDAPVLMTGAILFLGSYGASLVVAASTERDDPDPGLDRLYVPVLGPWLALAGGDCPFEDPACDAGRTATLLLVADGVVQAAGVVTMVSGLVRPTARRVGVQAARTDRAVQVVPTATPGGGGLHVLGRF